MDRCEITDEHGSQCQLGAGHDGSHMTMDGTPFAEPEDHDANP